MFLFEFVVVLPGYADSAGPMDALGVPRAEWDRPIPDDAPVDVDACGLIKKWESR